jgi:hypothetical protein
VQRELLVAEEGIAQGINLSRPCVGRVSATRIGVRIGLLALGVSPCLIVKGGMEQCWAISYAYIPNIRPSPKVGVIAIPRANNEQIKGHPDTGVRGEVREGQAYRVIVELP